MSISDSIELKTSKAKKMMLWFGLISITMTFAGLTSAFIVSSSRPDWLESFVLPVWFSISTVSILLSSVFFQLAKYRLDQYVRVSLPENINIYLHRNNVNIFLGLTILMAIIFIIAQFLGFEDIISQGYYFTGPESSVTTSYIYVLVFLHLAHLFAGIIVLTVVTAKFNRQKYEKNKLGFEMALIFWHFLGALWIYLFFFIKYFG
ncbi:MAG: cytochrome oxidase subunit III [Cryomorphaceae bacterium MED-G11]|jgi:cytochrome c oxidase subunit 3|nr:MAG: cytochrome oxidase subunit III [Cryomorphaceae bacterium MED-G11]|tara:strand:- start:140 stop:754 length:615 start_codon:yes stop_codon:yes gene_type:complete